MKRSGSVFAALCLTVMAVGLMVYNTYGGAEESESELRNMSDNQVYRVDNVEVDVKTREGYLAVIKESPNLIIYGDQEKIRLLKRKKQVPIVTADTDGRKDGEYWLSPMVNDRVDGLHYVIKPNKVKVNVIKGVKESVKPKVKIDGQLPVNVKVKSTDVQGKVSLLMLPSQVDILGSVDVVIRGEDINKSGVIRGDVVVKDARGDQLDNVQVNQSSLPVKVDIE
ncbi:MULTISPECIES: hypothetical protein [Bacillus]|uniref:hypothetical protein n=1 Tax=Bacillus TaxID=1386 RepID=UPI000E4AD329|nr:MULTISPECIES: hypothetical protein [Bacillus subtilis group]MBT3123248.1 nuclease A inhibitor family protein [Bacillus inaquosorum]MCB4340828.1 hypothetical protein [Bacillus subtilis]MCB5337290.1 hypothetical protein [Bacillus amyloliquefaciens]MCF7615334.1 nuclease A inhibitor family protein [Bacillus subtilis]MCL9628357.1 nuclease A inhibitor family protein [Bacillus subtilis]